MGTQGTTDFSHWRPTTSGTVLKFWKDLRPVYLGVFLTTLLCYLFSLSTRIRKSKGEAARLNDHIGEKLTPTSQAYIIFAYYTYIVQHKNSTIPIHLEY